MKNSDRGLRRACTEQAGPGPMTMPEQRKLTFNLRHNVCSALQKKMQEFRQVNGSLGPANKAVRH